MTEQGLPPIPEARNEMLGTIRDRLLDAERIVLTTHVNADGDGAGSECAVAGWLAARGKRVHIINPTPFPDGFLHLAEDRGWILNATTAEARAAAAAADTVLVLDTGEPSRIGRVQPLLGDAQVLVVDHHLPSGSGFQGLVLQDPTACATGELVYDLLNLAGLHRPWAARIAESVYTAILTDTGGFRYSNTSPRAHIIAAELLAQGIDPEAVYRRIYGNVPLARVRLLRAVLDTLEVDPELPITWVSVRRGLMEELGTTSDDLEGLIEHARSIRGTEVALLFRETAEGSTKVSLRSTGDVNVNAIARGFGGGGHEKASGALIGGRMDSVRPRVLEAVRDAVTAAGVGFRAAADVG